MSLPKNIPAYRSVLNWDTCPLNGLISYGLLVEQFDLIWLLARACGVPVGRRSTGNDVSCQYKHHYLFIYFFIFSIFFLHHNLFSLKECSDQKIYLAKVDGSAQKPFQSPSAILGPPGSHFEFCSRCGFAGVERRQAGIILNCDMQVCYCNLG